MVESEKMIHVGVGNEDVADLEDISGGEGMDIPKVEEHGPFFKSKGNKHAGIAKRGIDEPGVKRRAHAQVRCFWTCRWMQ